MFQKRVNTAGKDTTKPEKVKSNKYTLNYKNNKLYHKQWYNFFHYYIAGFVIVIKP